MKFLCVACDEAMALQHALGPDEGSMTVVFACPTCGTEVAMLTNAMETQVVRSLGVQIGNRPAAPAAPMDLMHTALVHRRPENAPERQGEAVESPAAPAASGSRCPFTGVVAAAFAEQAGGPRWTKEAEERLQRIPDFARSMVKKSVEDFARERSYPEIDAAVMDEVKGRFGMA